MAKKKQAVVIVHGMGEQRPMETLRSFVKSVWETDPSLRSRSRSSKRDGAAAATSHSAAVSSKTKPRHFIEEQNDWWIKPDSRAGLAELRRVTTGPLTGAENEKHWPLVDGQGRRTDFFEFYWADLVQGTSWSHLMNWIAGLLFRRFNQVPHDARPIWCTLWAMLLFGIFFVATYKFPIGSDGFSIIDFGEGDLMVEPVATIGGAIATGFSFITLGEDGKRALQVLLIAGLVVGLAWKILQLEPRSRAFSLPIILGVMVAGFLIYGFNPAVSAIIGSTGIWLVLGLWVVYALYKFLIHYFGDLARYVLATPENIDLRRRITERGLSLLTSLHESGSYDRIIVVAHSQGTLVAVDLINMLWSKYGPNYRNGASHLATKALKEMDDYLCTAVEDEKNPFDLNTFRRMQRAVSASLCQADFERDRETGRVHCSPWLISDLITLGSPLSHAEFLLARDKTRLDKLIHERMLPTCPPVLESNTRTRDNNKVTHSRPSFLFRADKKTGKKLAHHASCFAAVRWTNIYDKSPYHIPFLGDPLSGPVVGNFGEMIKVVGGLNQKRVLNKKMSRLPRSREEQLKVDVGILDIPVAIERKNSLLPKRWFTHSLYWQWSDYFEPARPPKHIAELREALCLGEPPVKSAQEAEPKPASKSQAKT